MQCKHCKNHLSHQLIDLGFAPPSNSYLSSADLSQPEVYLPLRVLVCEVCWLVQTEDFARPDTFFSDHYAYFSSTSSSWLAHAKEFCTEATQRLNLKASSFAVEIASNDGYLLKNFVQQGIPCLGIEPTRSTAEAARRLGIEVMEVFFGQTVAMDLVAQGRSADLVVGNNVYAHVPDINDFTQGICTLLKPDGVVSLEFPHLLNLLTLKQFDTIYHEHYSYLSLLVVERIFKQSGLRVFDVQSISTHGGSLRVWGCRQEAKYQRQASVDAVLLQEQNASMHTLKPYAQLQRDAISIKSQLLQFLLLAQTQGKQVVAYGAAAKGNTLLNFSGVKTDLIECVFDAATAKQGQFMPGSHIPILSPDRLPEYSPDYVVILPWNLRAEVTHQLSELKSKGAKFVTFIPRLEIF
jgi:SAM-dependent methyltransferase